MTVSHMPIARLYALFCARMIPDPEKIYFPIPRLGQMPFLQTLKRLPV